MKAFPWRIFCRDKKINAPFKNTNTPCSCKVTYMQNKYSDYKKKQKNTPPFRLCFDIFISTARGTGVIIRVVLPILISFFSSLLDFRLHLDLNLPCHHVHILRFSFGMHRACEGSHPGFLRSSLTLWAFLFLDTEFPV